MSDALQQAEALFTGEKDIPAGYSTIELSTEGRFKGRAPAKFHMRNFDVTETMKLGGMEKRDIPIKVPEMINELIYEDGVSINDFLEVEAAETMARFYASFYQTVIRDVDYTVTEEDKKWVLENVYKGVKEGPYQNWLLDLQKGAIKPTYDIDLTRLEFYDVPENVTGRVKWERGDFQCEFQFPRFGDSAIVQNAIMNEFGERDKRYGQTYQNFQKNQELDAAKKRGELVDPGAYTYIPESELREVRKYELEKTAYSLKLLKGLYLASVNGVDISDKKLTERVKIAEEEPRIDYCCFQTVSEYFQNLKVGIKPEVTVKHPITGKMEKINHPFRALEILTLIRNFRPDGCNLTVV